MSWAEIKILHTTTFAVEMPKGMTILAAEQVALAKVKAPGASIHEARIVPQEVEAVLCAEADEVINIGD